jgi:hypothetical protein
MAEYPRRKFKVEPEEDSLESKQRHDSRKKLQVHVEANEYLSNTFLNADERRMVDKTAAALTLSPTAERDRQKQLALDSFAESVRKMEIWRKEANSLRRKLILEDLFHREGSVASMWRKANSAFYFQEAEKTYHQVCEQYATAITDLKTEYTEELRKAKAILRTNFLPPTRLKKYEAGLCAVPTLVEFDVVKTFVGNPEHLLDGNPKSA